MRCLFRAGSVPYADIRHRSYSGGCAPYYFDETAFLETPLSLVSGLI